MSGIPVLVPADEHHGVLAAARGLRKAGYAPSVAVWEQGWYVARSRAVEHVVEVASPATDAEAFVAGVAAAAARLGARAVLPSAEISFLALAGRDDDFPGVALGVPDPATVELATDKARVYDLAREVGIQTPPTREAAAADVHAAAGDLGFPLLVKPLRSRIVTPDGAVVEGVARTVADAAELDAALAEVPGERWLLQSRVEGALYSVSGLVWAGELLCAIHQASRRIWPPQAGGSASAVTLERDPELDEALAALLRSVGWSGIYQAQFIRRERDAFLIDFNPRVYGTIAAAIRAGVNLPALWADLVLGGTPPIPEYARGVEFRAGEKDVRALPRLALNGAWREAATGLVPRRRTARAVLAWNDPLPALTSLGKVLGRLRG